MTSINIAPALPPTRLWEGDRRQRARVCSDAASLREELRYRTVQAQQLREQTVMLAQQCLARETLLRLLIHDMREPLESLTALAAHIETTPGVPDALRAEVHREAHAIGLALARLNEAVEMERLAEDVVPLDPCPVELRGLLRRVIEPLGDSGHVLSVLPGDDVQVTTNEVLLERAVEKLARNALTHTPLGTTVELTAGREADAVIVRVEDDGPGVPPEMWDRVWQPFDRGNAPITRPGLGLGLALARQLVLLLGGEITLGAGERGGACFTVRLPTG